MEPREYFNLFNDSDSTEIFNMTTEGNGADVREYLNILTEGTTDYTGTVYYCDPIAGDMANDGLSEATAWGSLEALFVHSKKDTLNALDVIKAMDGAHGRAMLTGANNTNYIKITAAEGHVPKAVGIVFNDSDYWHIDGLTITADGTGGTWPSGNHDAISLIDTSFDSEYIKITNCEIYMREDSSSWDQAQWLVETEERSLYTTRFRGNNMVFSDNHLYNTYFGMIVQTISGVTIINNVIEKFGADAIQLQNTSNLLIYNNRIVDAYMERYDTPEQANHDDGIQLVGITHLMENIYIGFNTIMNISRPVTPEEIADDLISYQFQGVIVSDGQVKNCIIENNFVVGDGWHGITVNGAEDTVVQNNTILKNPARINPDTAVFPQIRIIGKIGSYHINTVVRNNAYANITVDPVGDIILENNVQVTQNNETAFYEDYNNYNCIPKAGGPLVDAGVNKVLTSKDIAGNPRLVGASVDAGAYERQ